MAASSVWVIALVDWLAVVAVLPPSAQTLTRVSRWSRLHTFCLQRHKVEFVPVQPVDHNDKCDSRSRCSRPGEAEHMGPIPHR